MRRLGDRRLEIVKRSDATKDFQVLPKRWVVERTQGWVSRNRRVAKDFKALTEIATTYIYGAMIMLMTRRLSKSLKSNTIILKRTLSTLSDEPS